MGILGTTTYEVDNLIVGEFVTDYRYPVASGENVTRGQVMKLASGKLTPCLTSETPNTIMLEDVDATAGDAIGGYLVKGTVLESEVNYNTGSADEFREALRSVQIITKG